MNSTLLEKYAQLIVQTGVNIQKGQTLVIFSPIETAPFTRLMAQAAYQVGAKEVVVKWQDEELSKLKLLHAPDEVLEEFPAWRRDFYLSYARQGAAFVSIYAEDPELMQAVNPERITKANKAMGEAIAEYKERKMSNKNAWCVVSIPTKSWAQKVFPDLSAEEAVEKLWETICKAVRADQDDPTAAWEQHKTKLKRSLDFLNSHAFQSLRYRNALGTDITIELPDHHVWMGGSDFTPEGVEFTANMPTEEVFTVPHKTGVNGRVVSSLPLNYNGNLIEEFSLTFQEGKIVDFTAKKGYEALKSLIEADEGSCYLGEVALVPYDSPISNLGILFYNTLYDENASCHLAIGKAYPICVKNGENMSTAELEKAGVNDSRVHEDFMIGTKDLEIVGVTADGREVPVFRQGNFTW